MHLLTDLHVFIKLLVEHSTICVVCIKHCIEHFPIYVIPEFTLSARAQTKIMIKHTYSNHYVNHTRIRKSLF